MINAVSQSSYKCEETPEINFKYIHVYNYNSFWQTYDSNKSIQIWREVILRHISVQIMETSQSIKWSTLLHPSHWHLCTMYEMCACLSRLNQLSNNNKNVRFSTILPPNSGYTTEMAFLISVHLSTEITPLSLMLLAPSVKCVKSLSTKTVAKTWCQSTHVNIRHWVQKGKVLSWFKWFCF